MEKKNFFFRKTTYIPFSGRICHAKCGWYLFTSRFDELSSLHIHIIDVVLFISIQTDWTALSCVRCLSAMEEQSTKLHFPFHMFYETAGSHRHILEFWNIDKRGTYILKAGMR
jgi:hypothetical protein